jgi:predicted oxidoreductase
MEYRRMGRSGLQLSVLSFGSWVTFHKQIEDSSADELMGLAYDNGINFFDNAEVYALGESEKMMGRVLKAKNWDVLRIPFLPKPILAGAGKKINRTRPGSAASTSSKPARKRCKDCRQITWTFFLPPS